MERLLDNNPTANLLSGLPGLEHSVTQASACILLVGVLPRIKFKYGERGYRFALLEAGHISQNILLAAESESIGAFSIGGFLDDKLNDMLRLDGVEESGYFILC